MLSLDWKGEGSGVRSAQAEPSRRQGHRLDGARYRAPSPAFRDQRTPDFGQDKKVAVWYLRKSHKLRAGMRRDRHDVRTHVEVTAEEAVG